jgi:hypothetical protein
MSPDAISPPRRRMIEDMLLGREQDGASLIEEGIRDAG